MTSTIIKYASDKTESHQQLTQPDFRSDLDYEIFISSESTESHKRGKTRNYHFELHVNNEDTIGRYQQKFSGQVEDYHWDDMSPEEIELLLMHIRPISQ